MAKAEDLHKQLGACTKADLIWLINRVLQMTAMTDQAYYIHRALNELRLEKERQCLKEADKYADIAAQKRREYIELISPYDGVPYKDIPPSILIEADNAIKAAQEADEKWNKLVRI